MATAEIANPRTVTFSDGMHPGESVNSGEMGAGEAPTGLNTSEMPEDIRQVLNSTNLDTEYKPEDYMEGNSSATQTVPDLAYRGNTGPDVGVHTAGFRRAKFNPSEWHESNYAKYYQSFADRDNAEKSRQEADRLIKETTSKTDDTQKTTTKKIKERLHDVEFWKHELHREIKDMDLETTTVISQKNRLENALRATEIPLHIATDNLNCRRRRQGVDLVQDNVELALLKEVEIINNVQDILQKTIDQSERQIRANREAKRQLEMDWSDKKEAEEFDTKAGVLKNNDTNKQLYPGTAVFQQVQSNPESWAQFTHDNIANAENERMASVQLRTLIDNLLQDSSRDMQEQSDAVNTAFHTRLQEVEDAKYKLEENLKNIVTDIVKQEKSIADIKRAIKEKENPLKVATTRLHHRENRPGVDLCRDDPQYQLIGEVNEINQSVDELTQALHLGEKSLEELMDNRMQLEREISNKKNSLFIDRSKCVTHRSRYPTTIRLQGFDQ